MGKAQLAKGKKGVRDLSSETRGGGKVGSHQGRGCGGKKKRKF